MPINITAKKLTYLLPDRLQAQDGFYYSIEEKLGAGGNGVVHQCTRECDGEVFAIKFLTSLNDAARKARFEREMQIMFTLSVDQHDHLIRFISKGEVVAIQKHPKPRDQSDLKMPFVIMERADKSLRELIKHSDTPILSSIYMAQFRGLTTALEVLHNHAIHRDIKPDNILVIGERWVISDFGLCSMVETAYEGIDLTRQWEIVGPRFWMSPEANNRSIGLSDDISFASDIFQLAAVFWWVVNHRHPSGLLTREDWLGLEQLYEPITKALQHSINRRFESASDFKLAVAEAIER